MKNNGIADFAKHAVFTAQIYGTKVTIEVDHSDLDLDELFDVFRSIALSHGFSEDGFNKQIIEMADVLREDEDDMFKPNQALREAFENYKANMPDDFDYDDYGSKISKTKKK